MDNINEFMKRHGISREEALRDMAKDKLEAVRKHAEDGTRILRLYMSACIDRFGYTEFRDALSKATLMKSVSVDLAKTPEEAALVCRDIMAMIKLEELTYEGSFDVVKRLMERN